MGFAHARRVLYYTAIFPLYPCNFVHWTCPLGSWNFLDSLRKQNFHPIPLR